MAITEAGLNLDAVLGLSFRFSTKNVFGPGFSSGSSVNQVNFPFLCGGTSIWPPADLRSFFLLLMDARHWVVSLAAIHVLAGEVVEPTCVAAETEPVAE